jgi:adenine-specific DNA methylase
MIPKECKRLAEVDFPIAVVSKYAAKEKFVRYGHPATMHLWWARRPLAACRAMLLGLLLPDPCDEHCLPEFKTRAREQLAKIRATVGAKDQDLQDALLKFIGEFANWDLSANTIYLEVSRGLVKAAHPEETPLVMDPFAGGGSIPLEGLRLGCDAFASDLNPVACLILKVMLEDIPRHGPELAQELRRVGAEIKAAAEKELAEFYPLDPDGARPIAYVWARTVRCETPNCAGEIPLVRSFWLCKKGNRKRALRPKVIRPKKGPPLLDFDIFEPTTERDVHTGTVSRAKATCLCCNTVLSPGRVRAQLIQQRGGADPVFDSKGNRIGGSLLLAVITLQKGEQGRLYRLPTKRDYNAVWGAIKQLQKEAVQKLASGLTPAPEEPLPLMSGTFNVPLYGMTKWGDLFSCRQKLMLLTLRRCVEEADSRPEAKEIAGLAMSRLTNISNALCRWESSRGQVLNLFARQALPMIWDFAEACFFGKQAGDYSVTIETMAKVIEGYPSNLPIGQTQQADACESPLTDQSVAVYFTDPPYYFAIPYADLSDFFYVWLKRVLPRHPLLRDPFDPMNILTPKEHELCEMAHWDQRRYAHKNKLFFEEGMCRAFSEARRVLTDGGVGCVVFAHKTTEGWEALLSGMIKAGWVITASWPIVTEASTRPRAREAAALAASIHLICRPRSDVATVGDWAEVLRELPKRVGTWMERLQSEGVRGADLVFACIGPALEIYSRYSKVVDPEEREIPLGGEPEAKEPHKRGFLAYVWEVVGRIALEQVLGSAEAQARNGAAGALEEDARLTALFLWTLQSTAGEVAYGNNEEGEEEEAEDEEEAPRGKAKGLTLVFDVVRRFAQPLGIILPDWESRIIETKKGIVRLLPVTERAKQLFGEEGAQAVADRLESNPTRPEVFQPTLFGDEPPALRNRKGRKRRAAGGPDDSLKTRREATTLDRVHAAMLLQASGRTNALRALLKAEQDRGPDFLRLANALSALYPTGSEEKRLLDAMLLAAPK